MKRDDRVYLQHILDAVRRIESHVDGLDEGEFLRRPLVQVAVIRQLEIIGEASKRLSGDVCRMADEIPWKDVTGMRDKLTHDYFGVDLNQVWLTVSDDLSPLADAVIRLLAELPNDGASPV